MYDRLIQNENTPEGKATRYIERAISLYSVHVDTYKDQILKDIYAAEEIFPSYTTAEIIIDFEEQFGNEEAAKQLICFP